MGDAEKDGDGAPDEGSAQNTQTDADHHVFDPHSDGGDYGAGFLELRASRCIHRRCRNQRHVPRPTPHGVGARLWA